MSIFKAIYVVFSSLVFLGNIFMKMRSWINFLHISRQLKFHIIDLTNPHVQQIYLSLFSLSVCKHRFHQSQQLLSSLNSSMFNLTNSDTLLLGIWISPAQLKSLWRFLKNIKIKVPYDLSMSLLGICAKEISEQGNLHMHVYCGTIYRS
jgi:hypothetical protein